MAYIRHQYLFSLQDILSFEPENRYEILFSSMDITPLLVVVTPKNSGLGAPIQNNYPAMIYSLFARIIERIPTIKDLIRRLKQDPLFRWCCGFDETVPVPSEASYSRMMARLEKHPHVLLEVQQQLLASAISEGFLNDGVIAIDSTHVEARDQAPAPSAKPVSEPALKKKRGRKPKAEREALLAQNEAENAAKPLYEREIEDQLDAPLDALLREMPIAPKWGCKRNSETQKQFWFGYKAHLLVSTERQYILAGLLSSANLNDGKGAIPLLKLLKQQFPDFKVSAGVMDAGYDHEAIYRHLHDQHASAIIAYNRRREAAPVGCDEHFAPVCIKQHSYRYDSYDPKYETIKYTLPKECGGCPLAAQGECQKVFKHKIADDLRKYSAPARGSLKWKLLYNQRSAVERVNAYLKQFFGLENIRYRTGKRANIQFLMTTLVYNATCLVKDRLNRNVNSKGVAV